MGKLVIVKIHTDTLAVGWFIKGPPPPPQHSLLKGKPNYCPDLPALHVGMWANQQTPRTPGVLKHMRAREARSAGASRQPGAPCAPMPPAARGAGGNEAGRGDPPLTNCGVSAGSPGAPTLCPPRRRASASPCDSAASLRIHVC